MREAHHCGLSHCGMADQRGLDFCAPQAMAADIQHVCRYEQNLSMT